MLLARPRFGAGCDLLKILFRTCLLPSCWTHLFDHLGPLQTSWRKDAWSPPGTASPTSQPKTTAGLRAAVVDVRRRGGACDIPIREPRMRNGSRWHRPVQQVSSQFRGGRGEGPVGPVCRAGMVGAMLWLFLGEKMKIPGCQSVGQWTFNVIGANLRMIRSCVLSD